MEKVKLTINGRQIEANPGEMIIDAAKNNGIEIPHFCKHER
jgi:NADH dehydrogenase/NADH:ubiquinone oxidoreductase subunit G